MTQTGKSPKFISASLEFILSAVFIAMGGSMYQYISPSRDYLGKVTLIIAAAVVVAVFFLKKPYSDKKQFLKGIIITAVICIYLLIFLAINPVNVKSYIFMLCQVAVLAAYVFICCGNDQIPGVIFRYSQLVTVIAAASLICWILFSIIKVIPATGSVESYWYSPDFTKTQISYFDIYFAPQKIIFFGKEFVRNCSIFTEAPMFTWHLVIALMTELFINKKLSWARICILCAAILSTVSTMGYIWGMGAILLRVILGLVRSRKYKALHGYVKVIIWISAAAVLAGVLIICFILLKEKIMTYSGDTRIEDFKAGYLGWMDNFWTGAGFGNRETIFIHRTVYSDHGFSNGIMEVAAEGGVYLLVCFIAPFVYGFIHAIRTREAGQAIFAVLVFVMAAITSSQYTYLMYFLQLFMLFGLMKNDKRGNVT